jgi:hypothetical protein
MWQFFLDRCLEKSYPLLYLAVNVIYLPLQTRRGFCIMQFVFFSQIRSGLFYL